MEAKKNMMRPIIQKPVINFIFVVNYYFDMWSRRLHTLQPLNNLISSKVKFKRTDIKHKELNKIKEVVVHNNVLAYSNPN